MAQIGRLELPGWEIREIGDADRSEILRVLGLDGLAFRYQEKVGEQVIRSWRVEGSNSEPVLSPASDDLPLLTRTHLHHQLAEVPADSVSSLWDRLLPFPFSLWGEPVPAAEASGGLEGGQEQRWLGQHCAGAFELLESRLGAAEIGLLTLRSLGADEPVHLFFHCVRKKVLTAARIHPVSEDRADLADVLCGWGASFQHLAISVPRLSSFADQIGGVVEAIQRGLAEPVVAVGPGTDATGLPQLDDVVFSTDS